MSPYTASFITLLFLGLLIALWLIQWLRPVLRSLLEDILGLPAATDYFIRALSLVVAFVVLGAVADPSFNFKDNVRFMECVWAVTHGLKSIFENLVVAIFVYTALITVLIAALKRRQ